LEHGDGDRVDRNAWLAGIRSGISPPELKVIWQQVSGIAAARAAVAPEFTAAWLAFAGRDPPGCRDSGCCRAP
jgi:hypothetical protein